MICITHVSLEGDLQQSNSISGGGVPMLRTLRIRLFGRCSFESDTSAIQDINCANTQEILGYLACYRDRHLAREVVIATLWGAMQEEQGKRVFRQTCGRSTQLSNHSRSAPPRPSLKLMANGSGSIQLRGSGSTSPDLRNSGRILAVRKVIHIPKLRSISLMKPSPSTVAI